MLCCITAASGFCTQVILHCIVLWDATTSISSWTATCAAPHRAQNQCAADACMRTSQGYVHRVGRTGRAGQAGSAITLFTPADASFQQELQAALAGQQEQQGQQERQASHAAAGPSGAAEDSDEDEDGAAGEVRGVHELVSWALLCMCII